MKDILDKYRDLHEAVKKASDGKYAEVVTDFLAEGYKEGAFVEKYCLGEEEQKELEIFRNCPEIGLLRSENEFLKEQIRILNERIDKNNKIIERYNKSINKPVEKVKKPER